MKNNRTSPRRGRPKRRGRYHSGNERTDFIMKLESNLNRDEIDEMIFPAVELLNKKGYETKFSCSGHFDINRYEGTYIIFYENDFPFLPAGFVMESLPAKDFSEPTAEERKNGFLWHIEPVTIYRLKKERFGTNRYKLFSEILKANLDLLQWAMKLPDKNK